MTHQPVTPQQVASEETKLLKVEESVRIFVRVADDSLDCFWEQR